jgi:autotransporter adhesin
VRYDDKDTKDRVTLDGKDGTTLSNVRAGTQAHFAVNVELLDSGAAGCGGGAGLGANGMMTGPTYAIQGNSYHNVGDAMSAIDGALSGLDARIGELEHGNGPGGGGVPSGTGDGLAVGDGSHAQDPSDTAVGNGAHVGADNGTAVGSGSQIGAGATDAVAVGAGASATASGGTALGQGATANATGSVALGQGSVADQANTVSVGSVGHERRVTNVADGVAAHDAANVGQMQAGDAATLASSKQYTDTTATKTLSSAKAYTDSRFSALDDKFQELSDGVGYRLQQQDRRIDRMGAMSSAMMSMSMNAAGTRSPRGRIAAGVGWQNGESALSVGYARQIGDRASFSIGGAFTDEDQSAGVGFGIDL